MTFIPDYPDDFNLGNRRILGQHRVREHLETVLKGDRLSHAYLFAGLAGVGKKALALAFAEAIQGIDHLSDFKGKAWSKKSSWITHPDIRLFFPVPSKVPSTEIRERQKLLAQDPYEIVDFGLRPSMSQEQSKNKQAFYSIDYYREEIRKAAFLKPNEGRRNIIIISNIEKMKKESANAFLKMLEEPADRILFILTTDKVDALLPTILSRCQVISFPPLSKLDVKEGLIRYDQLSEKEAEYMSNLTSGNYSLTRFYDLKQVNEQREAVVDFLRAAYSLDPTSILNIAQKWSQNYNIEGLLSVLDIIQSFIRDIAIYKATQNEHVVTNTDYVSVIKNFCKALANARLEDMLEVVEWSRSVIMRNIVPRMVITVLAIRFSFLMRGMEAEPSLHDEAAHIPALSAINK